MNSKPPSIANAYVAFVQNNGPDQVVVTSTGTSNTATEVLTPNGVVVEFALPAGAKKVIISDPHLNGAGAKGTLIWAELQDPEDDEPGEPGGGLDR